MKNKINIIIVVVVVVAVAGILAIKLFEPKIDFPMPKKGEVTIIEIGADLCIPCQLLKPILKEIQTELENKNATLHKIVLTRDGHIKDYYDVSIIPVIIIFDTDGQEVTRRIFSEAEVDDAKEWIRYHVNELGVKW